MKRIHRYPKEGYIGGVAQGMGEYTGVDPIIFRLLAVFFFPIIYIIMWIFLPVNKSKH
tara:strand:- start:706 stop:879 length:174 start_codon:yes stop_codon:yes gene_type:complete